MLAARRTALDLTIEKRGRGAAVTALRYAPKGELPHESLSSPTVSTNVWHDVDKPTATNHEDS